MKSEQSRFLCELESALNGGVRGRKKNQGRTMKRSDNGKDGQRQEDRKSISLTNSTLLNYHEC